MWCRDVTKRSVGSCQSVDLYFTAGRNVGYFEQRFKQISWGENLQTAKKKVKKKREKSASVKMNQKVLFGDKFSWAFYKKFSHNSRGNKIGN